ncbi:bacteriochlorophyll 4-vinyl reductase [Roseococcus microcysteis]|uniref:bacteriochlorophyll 4-vinyl reductase n=1 Tax=Roseococcus microcysteis TaxID=2771361 RepID=UPI00168B284F|nr:bacteriochlorophyll 4-vinyl reductase [Roseococcus microcysteis]
MNGQVGPNAITRVAEALRAHRGARLCRAVFARAGLTHHLDQPPTRMVDEADVAALQAALRETLGDAHAACIAREAGKLTGDYLLAHRIPHPVQWVIRALPARLGARLLLASIARHGWTFAGSGRMRVTPGNPARLEIAGCPLCRGARSAHPVCDLYAVTLERLFHRLVDPGTVVREITCEAMGADACRFAIAWTSQRAAASYRRPGLEAG